MNDYADLDRAAIDRLLRAGDPAQAAAWADRARLLGRNLAAAADELRTVTANVPAAWSDGPASGRMITELTAVAAQLELLADLLAGQPASCAGLIGDAAAGLATAQQVSDSAPPPAAAPSGRLRPGGIALGRIDGRIVLLDAPRLEAGERATRLDDRYRTARARLAPPPAPPPAARPSSDQQSTAEAPTDHRGTAADPAAGGTTGVATNPGIGAGAVLGSADDRRQTWLIEDRDLYATGPAVPPVIGGGPGC